ncbi:hypothetical protein OAF54_00505 [bacterium]|nr:hypothetical protein [bacterium]
MSRELTSQTVLSLSDEVIKPFFAVEMNFGGGTISVTAGSFVIGETYTISSVGTTDFTLVGSVDNNVGTSFVATGVGVGDGTATRSDILRLWTGVGTLVFNGVDWTGAGTMLSIAAIEETTETAARGADIGITGIPSEVLALALRTPYQGRTCKIYFGVLTSVDSILKEDSNFVLLESGDTTLSESTPIGYGNASFNEIFCGYMDQMNISEGPDLGTVQLKVENKLIDLERPKVSRFNSQYQKSRNIEGAANDLGFDFVESIQDQKISWGRSS